MVYSLAVCNNGRLLTEKPSRLLGVKEETIVVEVSDCPDGSTGTMLCVAHKLRWMKQLQVAIVT